VPKLDRVARERAGSHARERAGSHARERVGSHGRQRIAPGPGARLLLPGLILLAGCAASRSPSQPAHDATAATADSAALVLEVELRRSAELSDSRGALRVFDQALGVMYRARGKGMGLDGGDVSFDGRPMHREVSAKGAVSYRLGRDDPAGGAQTGDDPWSTIANSGSPQVPAASARVKLAPFPIVTRPSPWLNIPRSEELAVTMLPPLPDVWYRVSLVGAGESVPAIDLGEGRWTFPLGSLTGLAAGRTHVLIEVDTSCGSCPGPGRLRLNWSSHSELEIPLTLL